MRRRFSGVSLGGVESGIDWRWGERLGFGAGDQGLQNFGAELGVAPDPHYVKPDRPVKRQRYSVMRSVRERRTLARAVLQVGFRAVVVPGVARGVVGSFRWYHDLR